MCFLIGAKIDDLEFSENFADVGGNNFKTTGPSDVPKVLRGSVS